MHLEFLIQEIQLAGLGFVKKIQILLDRYLGLSNICGSLSDSKREILESLEKL